MDRQSIAITAIGEKLKRFNWLAVLALWGSGLIGLGLLRLDSPYGIEETAAHALVLAWTVAGNIVNPVVTFHLPDLRWLLFLPEALYWPGSIQAVKIFALLASFAAVALFYRHTARRESQETALIAGGLLLISPALILQIDTLGAAPYLMLIFALGPIMDRRYRTKNRQFAGWYFAQLFAAAAAVSIHPMGLAYPLALAWHWQRNPVDQRQKKQFFWGLGLAVTLMLLMRLGWPNVAWLGNPLADLARATFGHNPEYIHQQSWWLGVIPAGLLAVLLIVDRRAAGTELLAGTMVLAIGLGLFASNDAWAVIALTWLLFRGTQRLIAAHEHTAWHSFFGRRGGVMLAIFLVATTFMIGDKTYRQALADGALTPQDRLLHALTLELEGVKDEIVMRSQWPAKTMLATRQAALPLPQRITGFDDLQKYLKGIDFFVFDPYDPANKPLTALVSEHTDLFETAIVEPGGVVVRLRHQQSQESDQTRDNS